MQDFYWHHCLALWGTGRGEQSGQSIRNKENTIIRAILLLNLNTYFPFLISLKHPSRFLLAPLLAPDALEKSVLAKDYELYCSFC